MLYNIIIKEKLINILIKRLTKILIEILTKILIERVIDRDKNKETKI